MTFKKAEICLDLCNELVVQAGCLTVTIQTGGVYDHPVVLLNTQDDQRVFRVTRVRPAVVMEVHSRENMPQKQNKEESLYEERKTY